MRESSLSIELDPRVDVNGLCSSIPPSQHGPRDALVISLAQEGEGSQTSPGYDWADPTKKDRHSMRCISRHPNQHLKAQEIVDFLVTTMAHELGHAIGFQHEHQRPDRSGYIIFDCPNLRGYDKLKPRVRQVDGPLPIKATTSDEEKLRLICTSEDLMSVHLPIALDYYQADNSPSWQQFVPDEDFDQDSLMLYDSWTGSKSLERMNLAYWVLEVAPHRSVGGHAPVFKGGAIDDKDKVPSEGDARRLRMLYPPT